MSCKLLIRLVFKPISVGGLKNMYSYVIDIKLDA